MGLPFGGGPTMGEMMPLLIPPKAKTGVMVGRDLDLAGRLLYRYYTFYQGVSLVKKDGIWSALQGIALEDILHVYQNYYLGGHEYIIDQATADELIAQGFGEYIFPEDAIDVPGYGLGPYGAGPYGDPQDDEFYGDGLYGDGPYGD